MFAFNKNRVYIHNLPHLLRRPINLITTIFAAFIAFLAFSFFFPSDSYAACYCVTPEADSCPCRLTGGSIGAELNGVQLRCDTQEEANALESLKNPICGTAVETIPYCSTWAGDPDVIICWKTQFMLGETNVPADTGGRTVAWDGGPIYFNGGTWSGSDGNGPHSIVTCSTGPFCCIGGEEGARRCQDPHPDTPTSCDPQDPSVTPPDWCFGEPGVPAEGEDGWSCSDEDEDEFHTFRPYPGEPCDKVAHELAVFCGNTLSLTDSFTITKNYSSDRGLSNRVGDIRWEYIFDETGEEISPTPSPCPTIEGTSPIMELCTFAVNPDGPRVISFSIDVDGAFLPIMGNTENVVSRGLDKETSEFTDEQKVNEYVSWYLNGVINNPSEEVYAYPEDKTYEDDDPVPYDKDSEKIKNFSGVLRKLLSHRNQRDLTVDEISGIKEVRHNQIAGYVDALLGIVRTGKLVNYWNAGKLLSRLSTWDEEDEQPPKEEDFEDFIDWIVAYRKWQSDICLHLEIPGVGFDLGYFCLYNPLILDSLTDMFFKVPLSSTEDRVGLIKVTNSFFTPQPGTSARAFRIISATVTTPGGAMYPFSELYFAHMQESAELADILQHTYAAKNQALNTPVSKVEPPIWCDIREVRSNPGDDLDPKDTASLDGEISYGSEVDCEFYYVGEGNICSVLGGECDSNPCGGQTPCICDDNWGQTDCASGEECVRGCEVPPDCEVAPDFYCFDANDVENCENTVDPADPNLTACLPPDNICATSCQQKTSDPDIPAQQCTVSTLVSLPTETYTPKADEVWSRLVAGNQSVFKRIFPIIDVGSPIETLWDIPASTPVTFYSPDRPVSVVNPAAGRETPELYFPHIGGVHQYFLQCIQTALRPKGFGEPCEAGAPGTGPSTVVGSLDPDCVGAALAYYMNTVIGSAEGCSRSLEGLGIFTPGGGGAKTYISQVNPKLVVLYNNFSFASEIPSGILVVGRDGNAFLDSLPSSPNVQSTLEGLMGSYPNVDVWQAYNEPLYHLSEQGYSSGEAFDWLYENDKQVVDAGKAKGRAVCIGNFKEGWPRDLNDSGFKNYVSKIMSYIKSSGVKAYLCVHEHETTANWAFGEGYNGRFVDIKNAGLNLPVLVTVAGFDSEAGPTEDHGVGWNDPSVKIPASTYAQMLVSYQQEALAHGAQGVAVFQLGWGGQWASYDISDLPAAAPLTGDCTPLTHIKFLSPAFNLTNPTVTNEIANAMTAAGADWGALEGLAGNAYNCCGDSITGHVNTFRTATGLDKKMMLTETGLMAFPDSTSLAGLASEMAKMTSSPYNVFHGLLFNAFGKNPDSNFDKHELTNDQISQVCGGACRTVGENSAVIFHNITSGDPNEDTDYINRLDDNGMTHTLSIYNGEEATTNAIKNFHSHDKIPVIRLGAGGNSVGPNPESYGEYLKRLDSQINDTVYAIAGPNEPDIECWAAPQCGCSVGYEGAPQ